MISKVVYLVDDVETSFVQRDIEMFSREFDTVYLFSTEKLGNNTVLPSNVKVVEEYIDWSRFNKMNLLLSNFTSIIFIYLRESFDLRKYLPLKASVALLCSNIHKANEIKRHLKENGVYDQIKLFYSFWFYDCIYLAWLRLKDNHIKAVTRAHGGDLFEDRSSLKDNILFRNFQLRKLDHVISISITGYEYLKTKYIEHYNKIIVSYLGSSFHNTINSTKSDTFVIVSCAKVRDVKRIYLIAEALFEVNILVTWIHIGDENLMDTNDPTISRYINSIANLKKKTCITFKNLGKLSNKSVFNFYTNNPVNLFISLSAAEGIPVSMMEAISFGIPVLSTDVGGCKEIVNQQTGILIPLETSTKEIAEIITNFKDSHMNTPEFRKGVREYWKKHFDVETNYTQFFKELKSGLS